MHMHVCVCVCMLFAYLVSKYLLSTHKKPHTDLGARDRTASKINSPTSRGLHSSEEINDKEIDMIENKAR